MLHRAHTRLRMRCHQAQTLPGADPQPSLAVAQKGTDSKVMAGIDWQTFPFPKTLQGAIRQPVSQNPFCAQPETAIGILHQVGPPLRPTHIDRLEAALRADKSEKTAIVQQPDVSVRGFGNS